MARAPVRVSPGVYRNASGALQHGNAMPPPAMAGAAAQLSPQAPAWAKNFTPRNKAKVAWQMAQQPGAANPAQLVQQSQQFQGQQLSPQAPAWAQAQMGGYPQWNPGTGEMAQGQEWGTPYGQQPTMGADGRMQQQSQLSSLNSQPGGLMGAYGQQYNQQQLGIANNMLQNPQVAPNQQQGATYGG